MARRLLDTGHRLTVFDLSADAVGTLENDGAGVAQSPAAVAQSSDVVFTSLPAARHVEAVLTGEGGILEAARPGLTVIDLSTIGPAAARRLAERAAKGGVTLLDAPVGGGQVQAESGTLVLMVGGDADAAERCRGLLLRLGKDAFHLGPSGSGQAAKVALNLSYGVLTAGAAEGAGLLRALGADLTVFLKVLEGLDANSWFQRPARDALAGSYEAGFRVDLALKDVGLGVDAGESAGLSLPAGNMARELLETAAARGWASEHTSALVKLYDEQGIERPSGRAQVGRP